MPNHFVKTTGLEPPDISYHIRSVLGSRGLGLLSWKFKGWIILTQLKGNRQQQLNKKRMRPEFVES